MNHRFGPTRAALAIVQQRRRRKAYSEVEGDLGSNLVDLAEEAGLLVGRELVCEGSAGNHGRQGRQSAAK